MFNNEYLLGKFSESRIHDFLKDAEHHRQAQEAMASLKRINKEEPKQFKIVKAKVKGFKRP